MSDEDCILEFEGDLDAPLTRREWNRGVRAVERHHLRRVKADLEKTAMDQKETRAILEALKQDVIRWKTIALTIGSLTAGIPLVFSVIPNLLKVMNALR
jgi:hypothetical protein